MRDHMKLQAFRLADEMTLRVYKATASFPREEMFGLTSQMRRASVSAASNIVEGCARQTETDYLRFLDLAYGSTKEVEYQASLAHRLGFLDEVSYKELQNICVRTAKTLNALINSLRKPSSPKSKA